MTTGAALAVIALVVTACVRWPPPPRPSEDLRPEVVGVITSDGTELPVTLSDEWVFPPDDSMEAERLENWGSDPATVGLLEGVLLLAGRRAAGDWWYVLAQPAEVCEPGLWEIEGGAFDDDDTIWFSVGLRIPKADDFFQQALPRDPPVEHDWFPAHEDDRICIDESGLARYLWVLEQR